MSKKVMIESVVKIVTAYVAGNRLPLEKLPRLITLVYDALSELESSMEDGKKKLPTPAVDVGKSVSRHRIVCLEDGKKFKLLKRHLYKAHGLSPAEYRAKWGLEERYPMVAPAYSKRRSEVALEIGLGHRDQRRSASGKSAKKQLMDAA